MNKKEHAALEDHMLKQHENPPPPFNPDYRPYAKQLYREVTMTMVRDRYYRNHSRAECNLEWNRRYEEMRKPYEEEFQQQKGKQQ